MYIFLSAYYNYEGLRQDIEVQEYIKTGRHVSHVEEYCTCHILYMGIRICSSPLFFALFQQIVKYMV